METFGTYFAGRPYDANEVKDKEIRKSHPINMCSGYVFMHQLNKIKL